MMNLADFDNAKHGVRYPDELKELAYQLWAYKTSRNGSEVSRLLVSGEHGEPVAVPRETVNAWARSDGWTERATQEMAAIAPDVRNRTINELILAALSGAAYIRRVNDGLEDHPTIDDILADKALTPLDRQYKIDARIKGHDAARKARIAAANIAIDRAGLSPSGKNDPLSTGLTQLRTRTDATRNLSDDELADRERELGSGRAA